MQLRRALLVLVSLCLLFSQQAALAHGISHIKVMDDQARSAPTSFEKFSAADADEFCLECLAFAQVMGAACDTVGNAVTAQMKRETTEAVRPAAQLNGKQSYPVISVEAEA